MKNEKVADFEQSKHCYIGTNVLINKLDIRDQDKLMEVEVGITTYKLSKLCLDESIFRRSFDMEHYLNIHKYLFDELYPFAGETRDEEIYKSKQPYKDEITLFSRQKDVKNHLYYDLNEMRNSVRDIKTKDDLINFFAKNFLNLNIIHPFREGNGRTLREFLREYAVVLNRVLKFDDFYLDYTMDDETKELYDRASILDDEVLARQLFSKLIKFKALERSNEDEKHI